MALQHYVSETFWLILKEISVTRANVIAIDYIYSQSYCDCLVL